MAQPKSKTPAPRTKDAGAPAGRLPPRRKPWFKGAGRASGGATTQNFVGTARASQTVSTYGPGALMDLLNEAVLVGGLDFWRYRDASSTTFIEEPRLRQIIAARMKEAERGVLSEDHAFRIPPVSDDRQHLPSQGVQVLQFPASFFCQRCRLLVPGNDLQDQRRAPYEHACDRGGKGRCLPARFVLACRHGHIEEFRWARFAHRAGDQPICPSPIVRLREGASGDVSEILVECTSCDAPPQPLVRAYAPNANGPCSGQRPWLGRESDQECKEQLRLLSRAASNAYFAQVVSGLSIPDPSRALHDAVSACWTFLAPVEAMTDLPFVRKQTGRKLADYADQEIFDTIQAIREDRRPTLEPLRSAEWRCLTTRSLERGGDMPPPGAAFHAATLPRDPDLPPLVEKVVLVPRLREVRVQLGFTRLEAPAADLQGEFDLRVTSARLGLHTDWLPAAEINGEGLFLQLSATSVARWEQRPTVRKRETELRKGFEAWRRHQAESMGVRLDELPDIRFPGARFYMLHSLSHLLMNALSLECGYSASSLVERLYCSEPGDTDHPMSGLLISTGTPGAEGTLGGLVEQGRHLERHLRRAVDLGSLCSHDPVCAGHSPASDLGERYLEGAACHGCLFVAECSCERFNQYLDRALVVPTLGAEDLAFLPSPR